jgi:hypothetical protein
MHAELWRLPQRSAEGAVVSACMQSFVRALEAPPALGSVLVNLERASLALAVRSNGAAHRQDRSEGHVAQLTLYGRLEGLLRLRGRGHGAALCQGRLLDGAEQ